MPKKRADAARLEDAATTLANATRTFLDVASFVNAADERDFRMHGRTMALDLRERIDWIKRRVLEVEKVAERIEEKSRRR